MSSDSQKANHPSRPLTQYARSGEVSIAYQVLGDGSQDIVVIPGFPSHLEYAWEHPRLSYFYRRLAALGRLVLLDKRGVGMSDRTAPDRLPGIEQRKEDVVAVLDAIGVERAVLIGASDGGPLALYCAAAYPDRASQLVVINTYARRIVTEGYPWALTEEQWGGFVTEAAEHWGEPIFVDVIAPGHVDDREFAEWWSAFMRQSMSPGAAMAMMEMNSQIDIRTILPAIHVPTLVIHRTGDLVCPVGGGRFIASQIEGARFVELPGDDHLPWLGDVEAVLEAVEAFVAGHVAAPIPSSSLATLLFTDIVGSTKAAADLGDRRWNSLLQTHYDVVTTQLRRFEGREITRTGDGILGVFDGPARAIRCAMAIRERLQALGLEIRAGIHTSEVQFEDGDVSGLGVHIAARLMGLADPGQIVVSAVVRDLAFGSGLAFVDRGERVLKGVPGRWVTFSVEAASTPADSRV